MTAPADRPPNESSLPVTARGLASEPTAPLGETAAPLTEAHFQLLRRFAAARRPVKNAARVARVSAISTLVIGVAGIPLALFDPSWLGTGMVLGICAVGVIELSGARRIRRGLPSAAGFLGRNQLAFMGLIVAYCVIQMITFARAANSPPAGSADLQAQLSQMPELQQYLSRQFQGLLTYGFYGLVIVLSLAFQGGLALYYFSRQRHLQALRQTTPPWVQRLFVELDL